MMDIHMLLFKQFLGCISCLHNYLYCISMIEVIFVMHQMDTKVKTFNCKKQKNKKKNKIHSIMLLGLHKICWFTLLCCFIPMNQFKMKIHCITSSLKCFPKCPCK